MRRILSITALLVASLLASAAATAGGPPIVNSTEHSFEQPFFDSPTFDCASGNDALADGVFSGVFHTLVKPDGSLNLSAKVRGTAQLDDLPTDGVIDATSRFVFNFTDIVFATGKEVHHATETGTVTVTATGEELHFQVVAQLVLDKDGNPKLDLLHFVCD